MRVKATGIKVLALCAVLVAVMLTVSCQTTVTYLEPKAEDDTLVIGIVELEAKGMAGQFNGVHRKGITLTFLNTEGEEVTVPIIREDGLFMTRKLGPGINHLIKASYAYSESNGHGSFWTSLNEPKAYQVVKGYVNNLGYINWQNDKVLDRYFFQWSIDYDSVEAAFLKAFPESLWNEYGITRL